MKKIIFIILMSFVSFLGHSQINENFDAGIPTTWTVLDNGVGTIQSWGTTTTVANVYGGVGASAEILRENIGAGNTSEDWLITPLQVIPANHQLKFFTRKQLAGNRGAIYQIRVSSTTATGAGDFASYTIVKSYTEDEIAAIANVYEEKTVSLSAYAGSRYVAFVRVNTQPADSTSGDKWLIDNAKIVQECVAPTILVTSLVTSSTSSIGFTGNVVATNFDYEFGQTGFVLGTGTQILNSTLNPQPIIGLLPSTGYQFYVRNKCSTGEDSPWAGPFNWNTKPKGTICADPLIVSALPYQVAADNTNNYFTETYTTQATSCGATPAGTNYLAGNSVFYSYTATTSGLISITMTPLGATNTNSSVFVFSGCPVGGAGAPCVAGLANTNANVRVVNLTVTSGQTYIIAISSSATTPAIAYSLVIQQENCLPKPTALGVTAASINQTSAELFWTDGGYSNWDIAVQPLGSAIPASGGNYQTDQNPYQLTGLTAGTQYQYWVRAECSTGSGIFTAWAGPYAFNTQICDALDTCNFKFRLSSSNNAGWQTTRMQVRQNGIVVATIGSTYPTGPGPVDVIVPLCKNVPFDLYWSVAGAQLQRAIVKIYNGFDQLIFTKAAGVGAAGDIVYSETAVNCDTPRCNIAPVSLVCNNLTTTTAQLTWSATATTTWDVYYVPTGSAPPNPATVPTVSGVTSNPYTVTGLTPDTTYDFYVRVQCSPDPSAWSAVSTCTTIATCPKPTPLAVTVGTITQTQAVLNWTTGTPATDTNWEILLIPSPTYILPTLLPSANGPYPTGSLLYNVNGVGTTSFLATGLTPATIYFYYIRTVCPGPDNSTWGTAAATTNPIAFNTVTCDIADKCGYKFILTNTTGSSWNGGRMQVRQNGIVVGNLGAGSINAAAGVTVQLCNNVAFDLYWSVAGTAPEQIGVSIQNPFTDVIYTKAPGTGAALEILYNSTTVCTPPSCPKPTTLTAINNTTDGATLGWTEVGTATQWEVYAVPVGSPLPVNGQPLSAGTGDYRIVTGTGPVVTYNITGLLSGTAYIYYVRAICSPTSLSTWTILNPKTFNTKSGNDECTTAVPVPVNPEKVCVQQVAGNTLGSTNSGLTIVGAGCGTTDDDVWFSFVAGNSIQIINLNSIVPTPSTATVALSHTVFSGDCTTLVKIYCSTALTSVATGLTPGQTYYIRVYTAGSVAANSAAFNICITTPPPPNPNDECINAISLQVNTLSECNIVNPAYISGATASTQPIGTVSPTNILCFGSADDDVWYSFVANSGTEIVSLLNVTGTTTDLNHAIYSGDCNSLVRLNCSADGSLQTITKNLVVGNTYYIRVWSFEATSQVAYFDLCVKPVSSCQNAAPFCGSSITNPYIYPNTTGLPDTSQVACLGSIPNPTYYTLHVDTNGLLAFNILQYDGFDVDGNPVGATHDVDFVAWGPFTSTQSCDQIAFSDCPTCPFSNTPSTGFYPFGNIIDCSYSASFTETLTIPNAVAGQFYIILVTNFSNQPGFIRLVQTNFGEPAAGTTICCNVGLGDDINICANDVVLDALANVQDLNNVPSTFEWYNGTDLIPNETGATYTATASGTYTVKGACGLNPVEDTIVVTLSPPIVATTPADYVLCDVLPNDGLAQFDLTTLTPQVLGTLDPASYNVTYHTSNADASATPAVGAIDTAGLFTNTTPGTQIIHIRVESIALATCFSVVPVNLIVKEIGDASFQYDIVPSDYCKVPGAANPTVVITGTPTGGTTGVTGTFSYTATPTTAVLDINTTTGEINLANSDPGSYVITYSVSGTSLCADVSSSVTVNISSPPTGTFSYPLPVYCSNGVNPSPILSGAAGIFSALPAGLIVDATTGVIDLATSTAGTYTVYNQIPAAGPCGVILEQTTITITALPDASFSYSAAQYCKDEANPSPIFGAGVAGVFSATPTDLIINPATGEIDLVASPVGNYSVINTIAAANGCEEVVSTSVSVTIIAPPIGTFAYSQPSYCSNGTNPSPVLDGVAGVFSASPAGLVFVNTSTGEVDLAASTAGTYTITNTIAPAAGCNQVVEITSITITTLPDASFSYSAAQYCKDEANPSPIFGAGVAGVFSATPTDLVINPATGEIDLVASPVGNYSVINTIAAANGCEEVVSTPVSVTIIAPPIGTFAYSQPSYCSNGTNPSPVLDGVAGVFSASPAGLVFVNTSTGEVDLAASTAGTYTITNTIAPAAGCNQVVEVTTITITALPDATFTYSATEYCKNASNPLPIFTTGVAGEFSATPNGLSINTVTGEITLATSTAGVYVVTNKILASGGCGDVIETFTVTVTDPKVATFTYGTTGFYCKDGGTVSPTFATGGAAGTFTVVPATGLDINTTTGVITLASSDAGSYTVTNTIVSVGGCSGDVQTFNITVTAPITGTITYNEPFCKSDLTLQSVVNTAPTGGTYVSTTGLSIDATTGVINPNASEAGTFTVEYVIAAANGCGEFRAPTSVTILPEFTVKFNSGCDKGINYKITAIADSGIFPTNSTYVWTGVPNTFVTTVANPETITVVSNGVYKVVVTSPDGCTAENTYNATNVSCTIQKGISPGNDDKNNCFDLTTLNVTKLEIFNRYGSKVFSQNNYTNQWCGQSDKGEELPDGTYYYVIERNNEKAVTGWVYINREKK